MSGKAQIIGAILKLDRPFKASTIVQMTGLSRQLVFNHMKRMVEEGHLEKIDKSYVTRNKEELLNSLVEQSERIETSLPQPGGFFTSVNGINRMAESAVAARILDLPMSGEYRDSMIQKCDDSIKVLKQLRKYLTNATKSEGSARKFFKKLDDEQLYNVWKEFAGECHEEIAVDEDEFMKAYKEAMTDEDD